MLPLANRVVGNQFNLHGKAATFPESPVDDCFFLHGGGWQNLCQVEDYDEHSVSPGLTSRCDCGFDYRAKLIYRLVGKQFFTGLELTHLGERSMGYGLGFHPWFYLTPSTKVQFSATGYWPEGEHYLPQAWRGEMTTQTNFLLWKIPDNQSLNVGYSGWSGKAVLESGSMQIQLSCATLSLTVFRMPDEPFSASNHKAIR